MTYTLEVDEGVDTDTIDRVMGFFPDKCPVHRSISGSIAFTHDLELVPHT